MLNKLKQILNFPICKFKPSYNFLKPWKWNLRQCWIKTKKFIWALAVLMFVVAAFIIVKDEISYQFGSGDYSSEETQPSETASSDKDCNVYGIELHGELVTYISPADLDKDGNPMKDQVASEDIVAAINGADKDDSIKAIILEVDSYGGSPVAGQEVNEALKNAKKPTIALIRGAGASAAYLSAIGADIVLASKNSDVGSIGVTMSYIDSSSQNQKDGLTYNQLSAGKFKDTGDSDKVLTAEEKVLLMRDINILHQNFIKAVADDRKLDIKKVENLADGSTMLGQMALESGLIDKIGGLVEAKEYLKDKTGKVAEICW